MKTAIRKKDRAVVAECLRGVIELISKAELCTDGRHGYKDGHEWDPFMFRHQENDPDQVCLMGAILYIMNGMECDAAIALCEALKINYRGNARTQKRDVNGRFKLGDFHPAVEAVHRWNDRRATKRMALFWLRRAAERMEAMG